MSRISGSIGLVIVAVLAVGGCKGGKIVDPNAAPPAAPSAATTPPATTAPTGNTISPTTSASTAPSTSSATTGPITASFAPTGQKRELQATIKAELQKATKSIDIAAFIFTSDDLADAAIDAKKRGVVVRALFDGGNAKQIGLSVDGKLKAGGVDVKTIATPGTASGVKFHHKFAVIDKEVTITGSYNWTVDADESNYENLLIVRDKNISEAYAREFDSLFVAGKGGVGSTSEVVFSPTGVQEQLQTRLVTELGQAQKEVVIACYLFTSSDVTRACEQALKRGVKISFLFDGRQASIFKDKIATLKAAGADVKLVTLGGSGAFQRDFHHKFTVIDGKVLVTGSFNYTVNQDRDGYENIIVVRDPATCQAFVKTFADVWASSIAKSAP